MNSVMKNVFSWMGMVAGLMGSAHLAQAGQAIGNWNGTPYQVSAGGGHIAGNVGAYLIDVWVASDHVAGQSMGTSIDIRVQSKRLRGESFCGAINYTYDIEYKEIYGLRCGDIFMRRFLSPQETQVGAREFLVYELTNGLPPEVAGLVRGELLQIVNF